MEGGNTAILQIRKLRLEGIKQLAGSPTDHKWGSGGSEDPQVHFLPTLCFLCVEFPPISRNAEGIGTARASIFLTSGPLCKPFLLPGALFT